MKRTARLASLALVGTLAFTACGNDDGDDKKASSGDPVDGASQTTEQPTTGSEAGEEVDADSFISDVLGGIEAMDTARVSMVMDLGGQAMTGEGDVSYEGDDYKASMTMVMPGAGEIEMVTIGQVMFMKMPQMGDKFLKVDLGDPNGPMGDTSQMMSSLDPAKQLGDLRAGITRIVYQGDDEIQGEDMGHYVLTVDPKKIEAFQGLPGITEITYDVWLDSEHRMRQMELTMPESAGGGDMKIEVTDLGKDVDIKEPPASQVSESLGG